MESRPEELIAQVSQELRTPLHAMLGWAQMLLTHERVVGDEHVARGLHIIVRNAKLQARLIDDLLDASSLSTGNLRLQVAPLSLEAAVRAALESVDHSAAIKDVQLRTRFEADATFVLADGERVQQTLACLLAHALELSPPGGAIDVRVRREDAQVCVEIEDDGPGIEDDRLPHVSEYFRGGKAAGMKSGLRLGLAIARGIVELHGGTIAVSRSGRGACFAVRLPSLPGASGLGRDSQPPPTSSSIASPTLLAGVRIAIVDDQPDAVELLRVVLERAGAQVDAYASADQLLQGQARSDALVADIRMDGGSSLELLGALRERGVSVPAVALTGHASPRDRLRALQAGFQMHIAKPVDGHELLVTIASVLGRFLPKRL